jgi:hypothetical protein
MITERAIAARTEAQEEGAASHAHAARNETGGDPLPAARLRSYALAAVASHLRREISGACVTPEIRFLLAHLEAADPNRRGWVEGLSEYLGRPHESDMALLHLAFELDLSISETLTVALAAAVEDEVMVGRALAHVQAPVGGSRPTLGLIVQSLSEAADGTPLTDLLVNGAAMRSGCSP